jgi:predicted nucleic acid-binding protein
MKYVLDASVAFKWVVAEALSNKAQLVRDDYRNKIHELLAPDVFPIEVAHVLTRAERQGRITTPRAPCSWPTC